MLQRFNKHRKTEKCVPQKKIGFLKTHKCASSTIQNILLRFGLRNNLSVVLPQERNYLGHFHPTMYYLNQNHFDRKMISNTLWEKAGLSYDMLLCHTRWNHTSVADVLGDHKDVFYLSILREPVELFRSFWDYAKLSKMYRTTLEKFARKIIYEETHLATKTQRSPGFNQMLHDFGVNFEHMVPKKGEHTFNRTREIIKNKIREIDDNFDLVLLADPTFFEDSLILLKNELCWNYTDIVSLKLNSRPANLKSKISPKAQELIKGKH